MTPLEALQAALAGEHAAIYVYGVLGGRVSTTQAPTEAAAVMSAYTTHRARRDQLQLMVRQRGGSPVVPAVAYDLVGPAITTAQILEEAKGIESRASEVYAQTVGVTTGSDRQWAIDALADSAVRRLSFGGEPEAFPGLSYLQPVTIS
jgi:hypothetical protein